MAEMLLNGIDIKVFSARLLNYRVSGTAITHTTASAGRLITLPKIYGTTVGTRTVTIQLTFFPKAPGTDSRNTAIPDRYRRAANNIVKFETEIVGKTVEISLPDGYIYAAFCTNCSEAEFDATGEHDVTYTFSAIRHLRRETLKLTPNEKINCKSNTLTPYKITAVFPEVAEKVILCGVTLLNIDAGAEIIIDSENGLITENNVNKFLETEDFYDFPILQPGENVIDCSVPTANLRLEYTPVFA